MKKFSLLAVFLCYFVVFHSNAATYHWNGTDSDWNTLTNWKVGAATNLTMMMALYDATVLPGAGDIIMINYTSSSEIPKLSSSQTIASITIANGKSLDMNGYSLTVVGLASVDMSLANLSDGSIISTSGQNAELIFNPILCNPVNTRNNSLNVGSSFVFGATISDLISIIMVTNNSGSSVNIINSTFNVPCDISGIGTANITTSNFNQDIFVSKSSGSGTIAIGNPVFASGKKIAIGSAGFSAGVLRCSGDWSSVDSPISLGLTGTSALVLNGLTLNQALTATAPSMQIIGGGTYNENVALTVQNNLSAYSDWSGANFEKDFQITVQGTGQVKVARTSNAVFKGNVSATFANVSVLQFGLQSATTPYICDFYKDVSFSNTSGSTIPLVLLNAKFIGTTLQTLSATAPLDLANVVINNAAGVQWNNSTFFRISSLAGLTAKVIFTMGKLINNTPYPILFIQNTSWEGASDDSYIVGGVGKYQFVNGLEYIFPLGDANGYAPISVIPNYSGTANANSLGVNYYRTAPPSLNMGTAKDVSECEYWRFKTYHIIPTVAPVGPNPAHQFTFNLFWDGLRNCTPANLDIMGMARYTGTSWNQTASNLEQPEANKLKMVGTEVFHAVHTANEMLVTYAYKSIVKLDVSSVSASAAELVCNFDLQQLTGGQTTMPKIHPSFSEVVTLTIQGDADSEPLGLKIPMSAEGNPVAVNMLDDSPLNPALYKITGNTVKFFNEPTDETVYEDYVINNGSGLPYTNATNIDITVAAGMTPLGLKVYRPNGTLFSENATISGQRIYSPTFNIDQMPNGSGTFTLKVKNTYNEEIDIQGHYILSR